MLTSVFMRVSSEMFLKARTTCLATFTEIEPSSTFARNKLHCVTPQKNLVAHSVARKVSK